VSVQIHAQFEAAMAHVRNRAVMGEQTNMPDRSTPCITFSHIEYPWPSRQQLRLFVKLLPAVANAVP
jgi:hypothetical protein